MLDYYRATDSNEHLETHSITENKTGLSTMNFETLLVSQTNNRINVVFNRTAQNMSLNIKVLEEMNLLMDEVDNEPSCRFLILEGQQGVFCTGMDFEEAVRNRGDGVIDTNQNLFMQTLKRFALSKKIIISNIDGQVMAGGIGLAAASDFVIATPRSQFSLSEALWGLLPACVIPYLIRRVGFQKAYMMTLTTLPVSAEQARQMNLVDEVHDNPADIIRRFSIPLSRLHEKTIGDIKQYFRKMWMIDDEMEVNAIQKISSLVTDDQVQNNIREFLDHQVFPWQNSG